MCEVRAIVDGKEVFGWYALLKNNTHVIILHEDSVFLDHGVVLARVFNIDISTVAVSTGKKDKHGKEIFGSKGEMKGGDRIGTLTSTGKVAEGNVVYDSDALTWVVNYDGVTIYPISTWMSDELEVIEEKE